MNAIRCSENLDRFIEKSPPPLRPIHSGFSHSIRSSFPGRAQVMRRSQVFLPLFEPKAGSSTNGQIPALELGLVRRVDEHQSVTAVVTTAAQHQ